MTRVEEDTDLLMCEFSNAFAQLREGVDWSVQTMLIGKANHKEVIARGKLMSKTVTRASSLIARYLMTPKIIL
jgi:hypothetical protein